MPSESDSLCYVVSTLVAAPPRVAFAWLANPENVGQWALGAYGAKRIPGSDAFAGASLYDGSKAIFRIDADDSRLLVDYLLGSEPARLVMRISIRIVPGADIERGDEKCVVSMAAWRPASFDERRWELLRAFHDAEAHILRSRIERHVAGERPH
jgi:hypothetical protein